ncbi:hypothetical protein ACFPAF_05290 [Hymenobacter endophyticus]|uniref:GAF domain-containing protein n=1 Tax=Hymenobacter endophyticus TaxID=3076335 RepID=A0ABU3TEN7_9BACT|nr:hypothetical protein [Hymenobacter endophyticus]MDU0369800.1 hypothetical protein [Hymenobacter endophyticus]
MPPPTGMRELLFGDLPLAQWAAPESAVRELEPWTWFAAAQQAQHQDDVVAAEQALRRVLAAAGLESRQYLQAWHALRTLGVQPTATEAKQVLGVIVEVALPGGLDVLAAYADGSARYLNQSGKVIVWDAESEQVDGLLRQLLAAGQHVTNQIGPWEGARPPQPTGDAVRLNFLTPSGLHFGEAPFGVFWNDTMAHPVLAAAQALMVALMEQAEPGSSGVAQ